LALEADLAQTIADKVNANVSPQTHARMARMRPVNVEAQDLYLRGMQRLNVDECPEAKSYFEKAIEADPKSAQAHAALANCYGRLGENGTMAYDEAFSMQKMEASKAIALDESLPEGHAELANAAMNLNWDWTTAAREFRRALELNPSSVVAHERYAIYLERIGRFEEAIEEVERGIALDPGSDRSYREAIFTYYFARRYDQALALHDKALAIGITRTEDNFFLGDLYAEKGMYAKSISAFKAGGDSAHWLGHLGNAYARTGDTIAARRVIAQLENHVQKDSVGRYEIALVYAGLGDKQKSFAWLEESYKARDEGLTNLKLDPCMDPLRSDPRFTDLMRRVGLLSQ
jgi:tetratricopeptide (TPR) repeat protein